MKRNSIATIIGVLGLAIFFIPYIPVSGPNLGRLVSVYTLIREKREASALYQRGESIRALGKSSSPDAEDRLLSSLREPPPVQYSAILGLGDMKSAAAVPELIRVLEESNDFHSVSFAASALGNIGDGRALDPLIRCKALGDKLNYDRAAIYRYASDSIERAITKLRTNSTPNPYKASPRQE